MINGIDINESSFESDFNVEDEYKPDPLAPPGTYFGHVTQVHFDAEQQSIVWTVTIADDSGFMSDGTTPIAGQQFQYRNWLPRPGDESTMTARGRSTKRQAKINMLKQFADGMGINMSTKNDIIEGITTGMWIGIPVIIKITLETYEGRTRNNVEKLIRNKDGEYIGD